jgi:hypothetical protein
LKACGGHNQLLQKLTSEHHFGFNFIFQMHLSFAFQFWPLLHRGNSVKTKDGQKAREKSACLFNGYTKQLVEQAVGRDGEIYNRNAAANFGGIVRIR